MADGGDGFYHANYFHTNFWHTNYWAGASVGATPLDLGGYWHENYWYNPVEGLSYWQVNYWAKAGARAVRGALLLVRRRRRN